jgi:mannose-6-phosphate isomerase
MTGPNHELKPWGEYLVLHDSPRFKVKRLDVLPGKRLSYQRHKQRSEHWLVVEGRARVTLDGREILLGPGQAIDVPAGSAHRVECPGPDKLVFIEVQTGTYFGEDDIERLSDDYGRA